MEAPTLDEQTLRHWLGVAQIGGVTLISGWVAQHVLDSSLRMPGTAIVYALIGFYLGTWLAAVYGFDVGPAVAGQAVVPILVGTLLVSAMSKVFGFGAAGPRR